MKNSRALVSVPGTQKNVGDDDDDGSDNKMTIVLLLYSHHVNIIFNKE